MRRLALLLVATVAALPMLAGPGTISVLIGLSSDAAGLLANFAAVAAILLVAAVSYLFLRGAPAVTERLGRTGEAAISKVLGLLILCVGIQFLINGLHLLMPGVIEMPPRT